MTQTEALKLALEALEDWNSPLDPQPDADIITAIKEALAQEKALQALHNENERLGLYKDAYAEPERETTRLQCVTCGTVYADGIPPQVAQPEQEKERCVGCEACIDTACGRDECPKGWPKAAQPEQHQDWCASLTQLLMSMPPKPAPCNCKPPQRKPLTDEEIMNIAKVSCIGISPHEDTLNFAKVIEAVHGIKE